MPGSQSTTENRWADDSLPYEVSLNAPGSSAEVSSDLQLDARALERTIGLLIEESPDNPWKSWTTVASLLSAWLPGMSFEDICAVGGIQRERFVRVLHGDVRPTASERARLQRALQMLGRLRLVLHDEAIAGWFGLPVPALNGRSPLNEIRSHRLHRVEELVESYFDPSYA